MAEPEIPSPSLQINFYARLRKIRARYLHDALARAVRRLNIAELDKELAEYATADSLNVLAQGSVRGEAFFPAPQVLETDPFLLGYYRMLYGFSQKEFYKSRYFGPFKSLEESGTISAGIAARIPELCSRCSTVADELIAGIDDHSLETIRDLQLLTLGPQLRGSQNTRLGQDATLEVYELLQRILGKYVKKRTQRSFLIMNDSKREVVIEFRSDPDIRIVERMPSSERLLVSIEIKGGGDFSNVHNRLGEAEKSHQKARASGSNEFWTILRVRIAPEQAKLASPTTTSFFNLDAIQSPDSPQGTEFREKLASVLSIRVSKGV